MSEYTVKNGLAQFWDRDFNRLELAKWVYNNPEEAKQLIDMLEQQQEDNSEEE